MIHATAIIHESATVASDCSIGPYSIIGPDVNIGAGTWIGPHVVVNGPTRIGERNRIFQFASIGEDPQDKKYDGETTSLVIGDDNVIREYATMNRGTVGGGGVTEVGSRNLFMAYTHVAHDCIVADDTIFANGSSLAGHVRVDSHAILAGFTCIHQFCSVGEFAFVGLNSVANRDVAPYTMVVGNYATARGINKEGLRRHGFNDDTISNLHRAFMILVKQRGDRSEALEKVRPIAKNNKEVAKLLSFVENSERGIIR